MVCLFWARPLSFLAFISVGGALLFLGILMYLPPCWLSGIRDSTRPGGVGRPGLEQEAKSRSQHGNCTQIGEAQDKIAGRFVEVADDEGGEVCAQIADGVDEAHDGADGFCGQGFGGNGTEGANGAIGADAAENDEGKSEKKRIRNHGTREKNEDPAEAHGCGHVHTTLASFVGMAGDDEQKDGANDEWKRIDDAGAQATELLESFRGSGQPEEQAHLAANKTKINGGENENLRAHECAQVRYVFGTFKIVGFGAQRGDEGFAL